LRELIYQDVQLYPNSPKADIHQRVGSEIPIRKVQDQLYNMVQEGVLKQEGKYRWATYSIYKKRVK
jgi:hypothetical protein